MSKKKTAQAREIMQAVRLIQARMARLFNAALSSRVGDMADLTMVQCNTMFTVRERGPLTIKELAAALQVSPPSASAMVERLVEMGLLERKQRRTDRREVEVRLSELGETVAETLESQVLEGICGMFDLVGPEYTALWCKVYRRLSEVLQDEKARQAAAPAEK